MKENLTILFLKQTGNVLAALSRMSTASAASNAAQPAAKKTQEQLDAEELKTLVGTELIVRIGGANDEKLSVAEFAIPAEELGLLTGEFESSILENPRAFCLDVKQAPQPAASLGTTPIALDKDKITVTQAAVSSDIKVWGQVQAEGNSEPQRVRGVITSPAGTKADLSIQSLPPDDYFVLAFAAGYLPAALAKTIS